MSLPLKKQNTVKGDAKKEKETKVLKFDFLGSFLFFAAYGNELCNAR